MGQSNAAYDLSAYKPKPRQNPKPQVKVVGNRKPRRKLTALVNPRTVSAFIIVVTMFSLMIYNQACLTEVTGEINQLEAEIGRLESEYVRTSAELDSQINRQTVADIARDELGLDRESAYQVQWVNLYQEDKIESGPAGGEESQDGGAGQRINTFIGDVKEYIQGQ